MIEIKNVSKSYGKEMVISECSATVKDSSIAGLIGVNGSGKSTLLRLIAGVLRPNSGEILYNGEPIYENPEAKKNIFFLPDEPFYGNSATTKSLVSIYSCFYPAFTSEEFQKYLLYFGITSTKTLSSFSKGMQRKVYLSAAFASHAKVLLLDEAFDGLDPLSRDLFKKCLIEFIGAEPSRSVIIASHSLRELEDICDSFCLVDGGENRREHLRFQEGQGVPQDTPGFQRKSADISLQRSQHRLFERRRQVYHVDLRRG